MNILRTPDARFADLAAAGWPYESHYADVAGPESDGAELRAAYVDAGPRDASPVLLMHGEPTWSYLYRKVIPVLVDAGHRVVAPDLIGLGRSDKPASPTDYSYARHVEWMRRLLFDALDLRDITFFGQDWGGLIGLRLVAAEPGRYARVCVANTGLPTGDRPLTDAFLAWQKFAKETPAFDVGRIVSGGCVGTLTDAEIAAYDAPFPDESYKVAARVFPSLVPTGTDDPAHADNVAAWDVLRSFDRPFLTAFSDQDPVTAGGFRVFQREVAGAQGQPHVTIEGGGHFLQEDKGEELGRLLVDFIARTSTS